VPNIFFTRSLNHAFPVVTHIELAEHPAEADMSHANAATLLNETTGDRVEGPETRRMPPAFG
jgi:hypothetical protein